MIAFNTLRTIQVQNERREPSMSISYSFSLSVCTKLHLYIDSVITRHFPCRQLYIHQPAALPGSLLTRVEKKSSHENSVSFSSSPIIRQTSQLRGRPFISKTTAIAETGTPVMRLVKKVHALTSSHPFLTNASTTPEPVVFLALEILHTDYRSGRGGKRCVN